MITTAIFPARYVQGNGALDNLGEDLARLGKTVLAITDGFVLKTLKGRLVDAAAGRVDLNIQEFRGECSDEEIDRLVGIARAMGADTVAGIGGGKALDTAKAVAHALDARTAIVPTLASTDAPCSALSWATRCPPGSRRRTAASSAAAT